MILPEIWLIPPEEAERCGSEAGMLLKVTELA
jgi:hypothetical protein